jgi:2-amino-1-hydroxyethylphosphonate dioxygenase (glycine-forming)
MSLGNFKTTATEITSLYEMYGHTEYAGEKVSQLEHALQTAKLAKESGSDAEVIIAAFLHDIGHLFTTEPNTNPELGNINHEKMGAHYLRQEGFSRQIALLVENHVSAKRYLTCKYPEYFEGLSDASKKTLQLQGGPMNMDEAILFEQDDFFENYIQMRHWDERAKNENLTSPFSLDIIKTMIENHLIAKSNS